MWLYLLLGALATWRLTYDFINTDGPMGLYRLIKAMAERIPMPDWMREGFSCYVCISFWAGFAVSLLVPSLTWQEYLVFSIGTSGAVTLLARYCKAMYGADLFE